MVPTMAWKRYDVFEVWAEHTKNLDVDVLVVGSEDEAMEQSESHGFHYRHFPNDNLGKKAQARLEFTKDLEWDYLLFLGSDDLITQKTIDYIRIRMEAGHDFIAPMDLFVYVAEGHHRAGLYYSNGYRNTRRDGEPMAVGRCLSRELVVRLGYRLWPAIRKHIDKPAWDRLRSFIRDPYTYRLRDGGRMIVDIKTSGSLSPFNHLPRYERLGHYYLEQAGLPERVQRLVAGLRYS